jgi:hypothetical protein
MSYNYARWYEGVYKMSVDGVTYASADGMHWIRTDNGECAAPSGRVYLVDGPMHGTEVW